MRSLAFRLLGMDRHLLRAGGLVLLAPANFYLLLVMVTSFPVSNTGADWTWNYARGGRFILTRDLTALFSPANTAGFTTRYSPVLAYLFAALLPLGVVAWTALHFAALAALPRRLALLALVSLPFWADVWAGNTMIFVLVAAVAALDRGAWGIVAFLALSVAAPRPLMLPLLAWLLWFDAWARRAFAVVLVIRAGLVLLTGLGPAWVHNLVESDVDVGGMWDFGPARFTGWCGYPSAWR